MNLFDVTQGCHNMAPKPRAATPGEMRAYLDWLAERDGVHVPPGVEYHLAGIWSRVECRYIVEMPGYGQAQVATCEVLDDVGSVVRTMTLPQGKRGGIPATTKQVRDWCGLAPVKVKRGKRGAPTLDKAAAQAAQDAQEALSPSCAVLEPNKALEPAPEPEISAIEPVSNPDKLPVSIDLADMATRLEALERTIAALSVARAAAPTADAAPSRAMRTQAHERAIRRAWAERAARRAAAVEIARLEADCIGWEEFQERTWHQAMEYKMARRRAVLTARRLVTQVRGRADLDRRALAATNAALAKLRKDIADPSQPERERSGPVGARTRPSPHRACRCHRARRSPAIRPRPDGGTVRSDGVAGDQGGSVHAQARHCSLAPYRGSPGCRAQCRHPLSWMSAKRYAPGTGTACPGGFARQ